jgi:hypothetical protein
MADCAMPAVLCEDFTCIIKRGRKPIFGVHKKRKAGEVFRAHKKGLGVIDNC